MTPFSPETRFMGKGNKGTYPLLSSTTRGGLYSLVVMAFQFLAYPCAIRLFAPVRVARLILLTVCKVKQLGMPDGNTLQGNRSLSGRVYIPTDALNNTLSPPVTKSKPRHP